MTTDKKRLTIPTVMSARTFRAMQRLGFTFTAGKGLAYENELARKHAGGPTEQEVALPLGWQAFTGRLLTNLYDTHDNRRGTRSVRLAQTLGGHPFTLFSRYAIVEASLNGFAPGERTYVVIDRQQPDGSRYRHRYRSAHRFSDLPSPDAAVAHAEAETWLRRTLPEWEDPSAYWEPFSGDRS